MCQFQARFFKHDTHLLLGTLHRTERRHHIKILMSHEGGGVLRWDYPLINENLTIGRRHGSFYMGENLVTERIIPVVEDVA